MLVGSPSWLGLTETTLERALATSPCASVIVCGTMVAPQARALVSDGRFDLKVVVDLKRDSHAWELF